MGVDEWKDEARVERWVSRRTEVPGQQEAARVLFEVLRGREITRALDLGTGDGRVIEGLRAVFPRLQAVGLDFSPPMLKLASERFGGDPAVSFFEHDLNQPLPRDLGAFDLVISVQAIHHLPDECKRSLYREVFENVAPGGLFCNVDLVSLPTTALFERAMQVFGIGPEDEDATDQPAPVDSQLFWLREAGFADVDCYWKWLAGAILIGERPDD